MVEYKFVNIRSIFFRIYRIAKHRTWQKEQKKTHPERAVLKGSGGEYVVTKVQMLFETTKLLAKKFRKKLCEGTQS